MPRLVSLYALVLMTLASYSVTATPDHANLVLAMTTGLARENAGSTQTFDLAPGVSRTYKNENNTNLLGSGEIFVGIQKSISQAIDLQLGIAAAAAKTAKLKGVIWDDANPLFDNKIYHYKLQHKRIATKSKISFNNTSDTTTGLIPWVSGSLGISFNRAYKFNNLPIIDGAIADNNFSNNTKLSLAYTLSVGIQKKINENLNVSIGYEFADWGKSELGRSTVQVQNRGLKLNHLYTNSFIFNITYLDMGKLLC